ncbi:MAG TPA: TIGR02453 family protein [Prevotellaceae bacterium]|nr:TIGR02453 family protein [Prevotellaceae bacterium]
MSGYCKDYQMPLIMDFLRVIATHNNRDWFMEHKEQYQEAHEAFNRLVSDLLSRVGEFDESVRWLKPADCTYRFYRDVRFSADKSPYKRHFGCYISARGKKSLHGGYYLHLQPGESMMAGGCYCLPTNILRVVRNTIVERTDEFRTIVENPRFRQLFTAVTFDPLKVLPHGIPKDFAFPQYVKCRNYCVTHSFDDSFFSQSDWMDQVVAGFKTMKPFMDFVNDTVDDYI